VISGIKTLLGDLLCAFPDAVAGRLPDFASAFPGLIGSLADSLPSRIQRFLGTVASFPGGFIDPFPSSIERFASALSGRRRRRADSLSGCLSGFAHLAAGLTERLFHLLHIRQVNRRFIFGIAGGFFP